MAVAALEAVAQRKRPTSANVASPRVKKTLPWDTLPTLTLPEILMVCYNATSFDCCFKGRVVKAKKIR